MSLTAILDLTNGTVTPASHVDSYLVDRATAKIDFAVTPVSNTYGAKIFSFPKHIAISSLRIIVDTKDTGGATTAAIGIATLGATDFHSTVAIGTSATAATITGGTVGCVNTVGAVTNVFFQPSANCSVGKVRFLATLIDMRDPAVAAG